MSVVIALALLLVFVRFFHPEDGPSDLRRPRP